MKSAADRDPLVQATVPPVIRGETRDIHNMPPKNARLFPAATPLSAPSPRFDASRYVYTLSATAVFLGVLVMTYDAFDMDSSQFASYEPAREATARVMALCDSPLRREGEYKNTCLQAGLRHELLRSYKDSKVVPSGASEILEESVNNLGLVALRTMPDLAAKLVPLAFFASCVLILCLHLQRIQQMFASRHR